MSKQEPLVQLPAVEQVGIIVKDLDKAIEYYTSVFGIGPFRVRETRRKFLYKGKPAECCLKIAIAMSGPIEIELIQVIEGESPHADFLREKGEGMQHLRFGVRDFDSVLARLSKAGIKPIFSNVKSEPGTRFAYVDSDMVGGVVFEFIERKDPSGEKK